jgi:hypothetical protein
MNHFTGKDPKGRRVILIFGQNFPEDKKKRQNMELFFIKFMDKLIAK